MSPERRQFYIELSEADQARYEAEMEKYLSKHPAYLMRSSKLNKHQPGEEERRPNSAKHRGEFRRLDAKTFTSGEFESDSDEGDSSCVTPNPRTSPSSDSIANVTPAQNGEDDGRRRGEGSPVDLESCLLRHAENKILGSDGSWESRIPKLLRLYTKRQLVKQGKRLVRLKHDRNLRTESRNTHPMSNPLSLLKLAKEAKARRQRYITVEGGNLPFRGIYTKRNAEFWERTHEGPHSVNFWLKFPLNSNCKNYRFSYSTGSYYVIYSISY